jgi:hypothetical protein
VGVHHAVDRAPITVRAYSGEKRRFFVAREWRDGGGRLDVPSRGWFNG